MANLNFVEHALVFDCEGERLVGVLAKPATAGTLGVVLIVGGPQYRVGSHRQFVLFARRLAETGIAVLRFDYRGMGDSTGPVHPFDQTGPDIAAAIDALQVSCPTVSKIVLWGLCDAASAALIYGEHTPDARVCGIVLLNPWVRSDTTLATTYLKHYYGRHLFEKAFWSKLARGGVDIRRSLNSLASNVKAAQAGTEARGKSAASPFQERMAAGLRTFAGPILVLLSERDLTAKEFLEFAGSNATWAGLLDGEKVERHGIPDADHTFSTSSAQEEVETRTLDWLRRKFAL